MSNEAPAPLDLSALSPLAHELAQAMARVASDIALVIDRDGVIRNVAEGASPLPAQCGHWVGRRWVDTASSDTRRKIELLLEELGAGGVTQRREVNHPVAEGDDVPLAWTAIRLGERGPVVAVGRDLRAVVAIQRRFLDAQHEMEQDYWQRRHADNRYRMLFHAASDAVLVVDAASLQLIECNDAALAFLALESSAGTERPLLDLLPQAARAPMVELLITARSTGRAAELHLRLPAPGQAWDVSVTPFSAGERHQLLLRARRHDRDQAADVAPTMMRALVESTPDAVVITDAAGHILMANPSFVALVQQGSEVRLKGRPLTDVVGDTDHRWRDTIALTRLRGLCPRTPLRVTIGDLDMAVEVSSTLFAEGDQENLGFTMRSVEPAVPTVPLLHHWPELSALLSQIGLVPLDRLVSEGAQAVERQLIRAALDLAGGQAAVAARLLQLDPQVMSERMMRLAVLSGTADDDDGAGSAPTPRIN